MSKLSNFDNLSSEQRPQLMYLYEFSKQFFNEEDEYHKHIIPIIYSVYTNLFNIKCSLQPLLRYLTIDIEFLINNLAEIFSELFEDFEKFFKNLNNVTMLLDLISKNHVDIIIKKIESGFYKIDDLIIIDRDLKIKSIIEVV